jgi:serine/threonine protein kinase
MSAYVQHPTTLVAGEWVGNSRILARLGSGSFGAVYKVECEGEILALKFSLRRAESDDLNRTGDRLLKELACLLQIQHPNIIRPHAFGRWPHPTQGYHYLLMDYVEGPTLADWGQKMSPSIREILRLFDRLALVVEALDRAGIRHRDLKGANILVHASTGEPVLVDFGAAHYANGAPLTESPLPPGTPYYRTPEAVRFLRQNFRDPKARYPFRVTDELYALGVAFYEVLTGRPPFPPDLPLEVLHEEIELKIPLAPADLDERIPVAVSGLVMRLLAKRPEQRPQSGQALHEELQSLQQEAGALLEERIVRPPDLETTEPDW